MKAEGIDIVDLSVGEPDFPTPKQICDAAGKAIADGRTRYTLNEGIVELREAIVRKFEFECGAHYDPSCVIVSTGAKQSLYNAFQALLSPGDEVIVPAPYWVSYTHMIYLAGGEPVVVDTTEDEGFRLMSEALRKSLTPRTRAVIINNPSNPTGSAYRAEDLVPLIEICREAGVFIISDEIYEKLTYGGFPFTSLAAPGLEAKSLSLIINGFSKSYSMTGWRLGYALGPKELISGMCKVQSHNTSNPSSISQWAGLAALDGAAAEVVRMRDEFETRRNYCLGRLAQIPDLTCIKPDGAFYLFPNIARYLGTSTGKRSFKSSDDLGRYLLDVVHLATVPGEAFGTGGYIRISYAASREELRRGMDRFEEALRRLREG